MKCANVVVVHSGILDYFTGIGYYSNTLQMIVLRVMTSKRLHFFFVNKILRAAVRCSSCLTLMDTLLHTSYEHSLRLSWMRYANIFFIQWAVKYQQKKSEEKLLVG